MLKMSTFVRGMSRSLIASRHPKGAAASSAAALLLEWGEQGGTQAIPPTLHQSLTARLNRLGQAREVVGQSRTKVTGASRAF